MNPLQDPIFRALFNTAVARIILKANTPDFTIIADNEAHKITTNTKNRNIVGLSLWEAFNPDNAGSDAGNELLTALNQAITTGDMVSMPPFHYNITSADGNSMEESWWQTDIMPVAGDDGKVQWLINSTTNITEQVLHNQNFDNVRNHAHNLSEELQATHEELSASNEQLASTNEVLSSTIAELVQSQHTLEDLNNSLEWRVSSRTKDLSESESRFRAMVEQSPAAMLVTRGDDLVFETINQPMLDLIDRDASVVGKAWFDAVPELKGQPIIDQLYHCYRTGEAWTGYEVPIVVNKKGKATQGYYNLSYKPFYEDGKITGVFQTAAEVTEMVNIRKQIQHSEHRLKSMIMTSPVGMTVLRTTNLVVDMANQGMLNIWNRELSDVIGNRMIDIFPELDGQPFIEMLTSVIVTGKSVVVKEMEAVISTTDGTLKNYYVDFSYDALFDEEGNVEGLLATVMDITDRVETRKRLEISEAEQQALNEELRSINEELAIINQEYLAVNEELRATNEELGESQLNLKNAVKEIKHNEQKLNQILSQLPAMVVMLTGEDQVIEVANKPLLNFWQKTWDEVKGRPVLTVFPELKNQPFPALWRHIYHTGEVINHREKPVTFLNPDGSERLSFVDYYYQPITDIDGNRTGVLATVMDVTDKVVARLKLEESEAEQQALNEELKAINEELASTNQELVLTNDELAQSQDALRKTLAELADSEGRLRYMLSEAPVAIAVMTGRDLVIESANKMVLQVWGKTDDVIGKPLQIALPELQGQPFLTILNNIFDTGEAYYGNEMRAMLEVNGVLEEIYTNFVYYPLKNNYGETFSIMLVASIVTEQVLARQKLERTEEMLRFSIEAASVGTWFLNVRTHEFIISARLKELFGFLPDEEVSFDMLASAIPESHRHLVTSTIEKAIASGEDYSLEHPVIGYHDQKKRWVRALGKLYPDSQGNLSHFSGLIIEITEQKQDEMRKNDFIGMVSHELKTPLTTITAIVQLLGMKAKKVDDTFTSGALDKANIQVKKMASMINGFLNISRLESGKIQLDKQHFDLEELVKTTVEENQVISPNHTITLSPCSQISVFADKDKIGSVISNILSNAVKYSPKDTSIEVCCELKDRDAVFSVKDQGIGIKPHDIGKLFERYYRVKDSQHVSGFGIGLYLSAEIVHRHGGKIWVDSEEGKGSTFYFSLPVE